MKIDFILDEWQNKVLVAKGNICICSGRQVGKSQIVAIKVGEYLSNNPKKRVVVLSVTEDQAELMIQKILQYLADNCPKKIAKGKFKPTKHLVRLTNGAQVITKAIGQYGLGVRGLTVHVLVADEAAYFPEGVWGAITPTLLTTGGEMWLLSTPNTQDGYFYEAYTNKDMGFQTFHVNSEEVAEHRAEPQRSHMLFYLKREKARMTKLEYAQQYLAQFQEEQGQFFSDELIRSCMVLERVEHNLRNLNGDYFLGVDIARMGGDESTFEILERQGDVFLHRENLIRKFTLTNETIDEIVELHTLWGFRRIYLDAGSGSLGVAVMDQLLTMDDVKRRVVAIDNATRSLDKDQKHRRKLLKEDLYFNFKRMMESGYIRLLTDPEVFASLKSIILEHNPNSPRSGYIKIYGRYSHVAEGLIRAAWAVRGTHLNIWFERQ